MKTKLGQSIVLFAILNAWTCLPSPAQEPPIEHELQRIQLEARLENYRHTAEEVLETRKHLALVHDEKDSQTLVRQLERLEQWQEQIQREIRELAGSISRRPQSEHRGGVENRPEPAAPRGHYLLELNFEPQGGKRVRTNIEIRGREIHCVNASDERLIGMEGSVEAQNGDRFVVRMRNEHHAATQIWERMDEGNWRVLEIPDRGEKQVARPVPDNRIEE